MTSKSVRTVHIAFVHPRKMIQNFNIDYFLFSVIKKLEEQVLDKHIQYQKLSKLNLFV